MRCTRRLLAVLFPMVWSLAQATAYAQAAGWEKDELVWRTEHTKELQKPDGWLSLVGLEWLEPGDTAVGSSKDNKLRMPESLPAHVAVLRLEQGSVRLLAPKDGFPAGLRVDGAPAAEQVLRALPDKDKLNSHITYGKLDFYPIRRGDRFAVRIKDALSPTLLGFHGLNWYPPEAAYRITAKWVPYQPAKSVALVTLVGTTYEQPVPGFAEFTLQGKTYRLEPLLEDPESTKLFFVLKDTTSSETTYPACRFLYTPLPDHGVGREGELLLDFNHLENPPCAYTPYATCPLPPAGNRLPVALPVGEQRYHR